MHVVQIMDYKYEQHFQEVLHFFILKYTIGLDFLDIQQFHFFPS